MAAIASVLLLSLIWNISNGLEVYNADLKTNDIEFVTDNQSSHPEDAFLGVYSECILYLSYTCIQKKTLNYLDKLDRQNETQLFGKFVTFVKVDRNFTENDIDYSENAKQSTHLSRTIDDKISRYFDTHVLRIRYGNNSKEDVNIGKVLDIVEGRKKDKGDSGGGGGEGGKKKMMMMAMMMMKMKLMMMLPAMMGMMGMMSMKGVLLGGLSLLISKVLLIMKLMGGGMGGKGGMGGGHGGGGGGDPGWMPAGGGGGWSAGGSTDYSHGGGGGGGGGYNANGEWQSRSGRDIVKLPSHHHHHLDAPVISHRRKRDDGLLTPFDIVKNPIKSESLAEYGTSMKNMHNNGRQVTHRYKRGIIRDHPDEARKRKRIETMSEYMNGMKEAVEKNMWE